VLREDNRAIIRATSQASKVADYLLAFLPDVAVGPMTGPTDATSVGVVAKVPERHPIARIIERETV